MESPIEVVRRFCAAWSDGIGALELAAFFTDDAVYHNIPLVEPGFFRTELLSNDSTTYAQPTIDAYAEQTKDIVAAWKSMEGKQGGDPAKLAEALVTLIGLPEPPARFAAGTDAVETFEAKANTLLAQARAHRDLSASLAHDDA